MNRQIHDSIFVRWIYGILRNRKALTGAGIIFFFIFLSLNEFFPLENEIPFLASTHFNLYKLVLII